MLDLPLFIAFITAASLLTITPGVDTAMVLRAATVDGRRQALMASLGIGAGCLAWGGAVALGLGALLQASELAYTILKWVGAGYLIWMGCKLLARPRTTLGPHSTEPIARSGYAAFSRGLMTNLLNPKVGVFYVTFLPQFVPAGVDIANYTFWLACCHVMLTLLWFCVLVAATVPLGRILRRPVAIRFLDRLTGGVFVLFGLKLVSSSAK